MAAVKIDREKRCMQVDSELLKKGRAVIICSVALTGGAVLCYVDRGGEEGPGYNRTLISK